MKLCCPLDGSWDVRFGTSELWAGPDGPQEFVRGVCNKCGTIVLVDPSPRGVKTAAARLLAAGMIRRELQEAVNGQ